MSYTEPPSGHEFRMPNIYPDGVPLYWGNEQTGILPAAVAAYLNYSGLGDAPPTDAELGLLAQYLAYYIAAPCWTGPHFQVEVTALREQARTLTTLAEIETFLDGCLAIGLDPI